MFYFGDLHIPAAVYMVLVTSLYAMMNVAYFTMLTPEEFIATDTVALVSHFD